MFKGKHIKQVQVWLTETEFSDLASLAECEDRKISEMCRTLIRQGMYGRLRCQESDVHPSIHKPEAGN